MPRTARKAPNRPPYGGPERAVKTGRDKGCTGRRKEIKREIWLFPEKSVLGMFVVPDIMGGAKSALMGNVIQNQFLAARDWPFGSALSIILALLSLVMIVLYYKALEAQKGGKSHAEKLA